MPRSTQLAVRESDICRRLGKFRKATGLSRVAFARAVGIDSSALVRYEHRRAMVPYAAAYRVWRKFNISIKWLVTGAGKTLDLSPIPDPRALKLKPAAHLSDVFDYWLSNETFRMDPFYGVDVPREKARWFVFKALIEEVDEWLAMVPDDEISTFVRALESKAEELINSYGYQPAAVIWERGLEVERVQAKCSEAPAPKACKVGLDTLPGIAQNAGVKTRIRSLRELVHRLEQITSAAGAKAALARKLGVTRQAVGQWLSGKSNPTAEATLQLLNWVEEVEAQPKQNPAAEVTATGPKTQVPKSGYDKTKPGPKKH